MFETSGPRLDFTLAPDFGATPEPGIAVLRSVSEGNPATGHEGAVAAHAPGLPQLDFSYWPGHIFWTLLVFGVLYWVFEKHLLPKIDAPIVTRRKRIETDLAAADALKSEIDAARARTDAAIAEARSRGLKAAQSAQAEMAADAQTRRALAEKELASRIAGTESVIARAEAEALAQLDRLAPDLAREMVANVSGLQLSDQDLARSFATFRQGERRPDRG